MLEAVNSLWSMLFADDAGIAVARKPRKYIILRMMLAIVRVSGLLGFLFLLA